MVDVVPLCSVNPCMLAWLGQVSGNSPVYLGQWGSSPLSHMFKSKVSHDSHMHVVYCGRLFVQKQVGCDAHFLIN